MLRDMHAQLHAAFFLDGTNARQVPGGVKVFDFAGILHRHFGEIQALDPRHTAAATAQAFPQRIVAYAKCRNRTGAGDDYAMQFWLGRHGFFILVPFGITVNRRGHVRSNQPTTTR